MPARDRRIVRIKGLYEAKPRRGNPGGPTFKGGMTLWVAGLFQLTVDHLKKDGWKYGFRDEAARLVQEHLVKQGFTKITRSKIFNAGKNYRHWVVKNPQKRRRK